MISSMRPLATWQIIFELVRGLGRDGEFFSFLPNPPAPPALRNYVTYDSNGSRKMFKTGFSFFFFGRGKEGGGGRLNASASWALLTSTNQTVRKFASRATRIKSMGSETVSIERRRW